MEPARSVVFSLCSSLPFTRSHRSHGLSDPPYADAPRRRLSQRTPPACGCLPLTLRTTASPLHITASEGSAQLACHPVTQHKSCDRSPIWTSGPAATTGGSRRQIGSNLCVSHMTPRVVALRDAVRDAAWHDTTQRDTTRHRVTSDTITERQLTPCATCQRLGGWRVRRAASRTNPSAHPPRTTVVWLHSLRWRR